ncbi:hypothetical protein VFPYRLAN_022 [Candidatus Vidania fulgoroideae]|nr:hypothetical protein VFPYRLAN_022 [Candidatus Vidania fulgoroideae]
MKKDILNQILVEYLKHKKIENFFFFESLLLSIMYKKKMLPNIKKISFLNTKWIDKKVLIYVSKINHKKNFFIRDSVDSNKEKIIIENCKKLIIVTKNVSMDKEFFVPLNIDPFYKKIIKRKKIRKIKNISLIKKKNNYFIKSNYRNIEKKIKTLGKIPGINGNGFYHIKKKRIIIKIGKEKITEY